VKEEKSVTRRLAVPGWRLVAVAACYVFATLVIANVAFGMTAFFTRGAGAAPARTGAYNTAQAPPNVAPVDPGKIGKAITEATGGAPTIGLPLPPDSSAPTSATSTQTTSTTTYTTNTHGKGPTSKPTSPPQAHPHH
jgi:hypothetical protein